MASVLNVMELSTDWAASGSIVIEALTIAIIITASRSDKYNTNVTAFLPQLLQEGYPYLLLLCVF